MHTFSLFLAVDRSLAMLFIFSFVPLESVPGYAGKGFIDAAFTSFPMFLPALSIILISFVLPIFNRGLSWGQRVAGIVVLYTQEAQVGGLYLSLAFRVAAIGLMSFVPGLIVLLARIQARIRGVWDGSRCCHDCDGDSGLGWFLDLSGAKP